MEFSTIEKINCDCVIPLGIACRTAEALKRNNIRICSLPFDWMMCYNFETVLKLLKKRGNGFFKNIAIIKDYEKHGKYFVQDFDTKMISIHDFPTNVPINVYYKTFHKIYANRFKRLHNILWKSKNICFMSYSDIDIDEIKTFLLQFKKLYKFKNLYYINIKNSEIENIRKFNENNITIYEVSFYDIHKNGDDLEQNPAAWLGNAELWDKVIERINFNPKVIKGVQNRENIKFFFYRKTYSL